jgi:putative membrane protein
MTAAVPVAGADRRLLLLTLALAGGLIVTGWRPFDRGTWLLEVFPVFIVLPLLWATRQRFPLTGLLCALVGVHGFVLMVGGAYTYARVPLGFALQDLLHLTRNPYDRIGHFAQGFVPALAVREILIRGEYVQGARMRAFLVMSVVLAISACYEFIEWGTALALGQGAVDFLGTQGDPWDTQWDMFTALIGAIAALLLLSRVHDRQIAALGAHSAHQRAR